MRRSSSHRRVVQSAPDTVSFLRGLRFIDSFFPSGAYAFSSGLEAAVQGGAVRSADELARYVEDLLRHGAGRCEAVAVGLAHGSAVDGTIRAALETDRELDAMKLGRESRRASCQMGRQLARVAVEQHDCYLLRDFCVEIQASRSPGHLAVVMGMILGSFGWGKQTAIAAYLYQTAVGFVSAGLRLLPIGQREGQRLLDGWMPLIDQVSRGAEWQTRMSSWTPIHDIYVMRHHGLTTRLFRS